MLLISGAGVGHRGIARWVRRSHILEPANVSVQVVVERHTDNAPTLVIDSGSFYWRDERQLDGQDGPYLSVFNCRELPAGEYAVQASGLGRRPYAAKRAIVSSSCPELLVRSTRLSRTWPVATRSRCLRDARAMSCCFRHVDGARRSPAPDTGADVSRLDLRSCSTSWCSRTRSRECPSRHGSFARRERGGSPFLRLSIRAGHLSAVDPRRVTLAGWWCGSHNVRCPSEHREPLDAWTTVWNSTGATGLGYAWIGTGLYVTRCISVPSQRHRVCLQECNLGTAALVMMGWVSMVYRIESKERIMAHHPDWPAYTHVVRYRLLPGIW